MNGKIALAAGVAVIGLGTVFSGYFTVAQYERAVVTRWGQFNYIAQPGFHFKLPFVDDVRRYNITVQQFQTDPLNTYTSDNQEVDAVIAVQWQIPPEEVGFMFSNIRSDPETLLRTMASNMFKVQGGKIDIAEFAKNRGELVAAVDRGVKAEAKRLYHLDVVNVLLPNLDYLPSYRKAQADAAALKPEIEAAELRLKKSIKDAESVKQKASGEADAAIQQARGASEAIKANADAAAHAIRVKGEAEAKAQELMADALAKNSTLVEYRKALQWDGKLPGNIYAGAPIPFLNLK